MSSNRKERDQRCLERLCEGDENAFKRLFLAYYEDLCRLASQYGLTDEEVEDRVQEVFLEIWRRRESLDPEKSIRAYLYAATRNEALKSKKRQKKGAKRHSSEPDISESANSNDPVLAFRRREFEAEVEKALNALPDRRREIFLLSRRHGLTYQEIASLLEISIKTVETQMGRALTNLEDHLSVLLSE